jgi:hypothetical protein
VAQNSSPTSQIKPSPKKTIEPAIGTQFKPKKQLKWGKKTACL